MDRVVEDYIDHKDFGFNYLGHKNLRFKYLG